MTLHDTSYSPINLGNIKSQVSTKKSTLFVLKQITCFTSPSKS